MKKLKILMGKPGLDGHDVGVKVLSHALIENGFEVVYSGLRKPVEVIVDLATESKADVICLSILSGTHLILCDQMRKVLKEKNLDIPWFVGGNIPDKDVAAIKALGAKEAFPTGTSIQQVVDFFTELQQS